MDRIDTIDNILEALPSGSGFDCDWEHIKTQRNKLEVFETYFHNMNENGYYNGFTRLRLKIDLNNLSDFKLGLKGESKYYINKDYYDTTIYYALEELKKEGN